MSGPRSPDYEEIERELEAERFAEWNKPWRRGLRILRVVLLALTFPIWGGPAVVICAALGAIALVRWLYNGDPKP